jgi:outer membrane protein assembly factor BamB
MKRLVLAVAFVVLAAVAAYYSLAPVPAPPRAPRPAPLVVFEAPEPGGFVSAPAVGPDGTLFAAAYRARGFRLSGAVYALDSQTLRVKWRFDAGGTMRPSASPPLYDSGRVYVGEGMHADFRCRMFALDAASGAEVWNRPADDHIEGGACLHNNTIIFCAGNDGVHCADAATGADRWHRAADFHADSTPAVLGGVVVVGAGPSRRFPGQGILGLDAATGQVRWRLNAAYPVWGSPAIAGNLVLLGLGTGRLTEAGAFAAGRVVAVDPAAGLERWAQPAGDAVFQQPTVSGTAVYYGSRDGRVTAAEAATGRVLFSTDLGDAVLAPPTVSGNHLFAVTLRGRVVRMTLEGAVEASWDLAAATGTEPRIFAAPRVQGPRLLIFGEFRSGDRGTACAAAIPSAFD